MLGRYTGCRKFASRYLIPATMYPQKKNTIPIVEDFGDQRVLPQYPRKLGGYLGKFPNKKAKPTPPPNPPFQAAVTRNTLLSRFCPPLSLCSFTLSNGHPMTVGKRLNMICSNMNRSFPL
eukprot:Hpha_TRINITY_DN16570_c2_g6::TRINITY_DN16570_c2_g6_i2::g.132317::m.132317